VFSGVTPRGKGFIVSEQQVKEWILINLNYQEVLKLFQMIQLNSYSSPQRWIIDFNDMSIEEAICYQLPFRYVKATKPQRDPKDIEVTTDGNNIGVHVQR